MKVLITGADGQLGRALQTTANDTDDIVACNRAALDISSATMVNAVIREHRPDVIINTAAYTAVDQAESDRDHAYAVNADGAANLATATSATHSRLIQLSTDYVFDGLKSSPYTPEDQPQPLSVYGASKLAGERRAASILPNNTLILRTSWIYAYPGKNFVNTMLRIMQTTPHVDVVVDQIGSPTWGVPLARLIWILVHRPDTYGVLHWSDAGVASWYDFAVAIKEEASAIGLVPHSVDIQPIHSAQYRQAATRPAYSVLDNQAVSAILGMQPQHWRANLKLMLAETKGEIRPNHLEAN